MQLIFVNRYYWPDESATSQMLSDVATGLAAAIPDLDVCVITSRMRYEGGHEALPAEEVRHGVRIKRVRSSSFGRANLAGRAVDYATFYLTAAWMLLRLARRGDLVIAKTDPPLLSVALAPVARLRGAGLVNWLQDIYPEVAVALGIGAARLRILRRLRDRSLRGAVANVVLGDAMAAHVKALGIGEEKLVVVPNWADGRLVAPVTREANVQRLAWGLGDKFVVAYSGNLGRAHDMETMLEAIAQVERQGAPHIAWVFIGGGAQVAALGREVSARGLKSVQFQPYQPRERLAESLSAGDVHLVSLRPALEGLIVPSKIYGILAAGRPAIFIGAPEGEVARLVREGNCGASVAPGDAGALARLVLAWSADRLLVESLGRRAREVFDAQFDQPLALARWHRLIANLRKGRPPGEGVEGSSAH